MNNRIKVFFLQTLLFLGIGAWTQSTIAQTSERQFKNITVEDGLPNPSVLSIIQDDQGFMWLGTLSGIVRYDGYRMQTYRPAVGDPDTLPARNPPVLYNDPNGRLWVGYSGGPCRLFRYDKSEDRFQPFLYDTLEQKSLIPLSDGVSSLFMDSKDRLWIGTQGIGLLVVDGEEYQHYKPSNGFPSGDVLGDMTEDDKGNIWIPTAKGLCKWDAATEKFHLFRIQGREGQETTACHSTYFESPATIWVGSRDGGLIRFDVDQETYHIYSVPRSLAGSRLTVNDIATLHDGKIAFAIGDADTIQPICIPVFDPQTGHWSSLKGKQDGVAQSTNLSELFLDYAGNLWIGTWHKGVFQYDPNSARFHRWQPNIFGSEELVRPEPTSLWEDRHGKIWIGTSDLGLFEWNKDNSSYRRYPIPNQQFLRGKSPAIFSIQEARPGVFRLGTSQGVISFIPESGNTRSFPFYWEDRILGFPTLWETRGAQFWLSSWGTGVCEMSSNPDQLKIKKCYTAEDGNWSIRQIQALAEDHQGRIWLGTSSSGLFIFEPETGRLEHFFPKYGVWDIHFDRQGTTWLATHSSGLKGVEPESMQLIHLDAEANNKLSLVQGILEDKDGMLWMMNPHGLVQFDPFQRKVLRQISAGNWRGRGDLGYGINLPQLKTKDGGLVFGERSGVLYFHPDSLKKDSIPPRMAFTGLKLFNQPLNPSKEGPLPSHISFAKEVILEHWQNDLSVQFAALHYKNPDEYRYRYKLEPRDGAWKEIGNRNEVFFTGLAPGRYSLWVQAANADGIWNETGVQLKIIVRHPWWGSWWAYCLYAVLLSVIAVWFYRFLLSRRLQEAESKRLRELDAAKSRLFTNITHEFRTPLTLILGGVDELRNKTNGALQSTLNQMERNGKQLLRLVNQMLGLARIESGHLTLNLVHDEVIIFLKYLTDSFHSMAAAKQISLSFESRLEALTMDYDPEYLQQVVGNLLSNALKFTPEGGKVTVKTMVRKKDHLQIEVEDTGIGIAPHDLPHIFDRFFSPHINNVAGAGAGIGLALTKELVHLMGGRIAVQSELGKGSCFTVELPVTHQAPERKETTFSTQEFRDAIHQEKEKEIGLNPPPSDTERPSVLIVEDNSDVRSYLRYCLSGDYQLEEAGDGQEGLEAARAQVPDLIISDVMMPRIDGFELCEQLKTDIRTSHIPIILLTARADTDSRLAGLKRGADAYLAKPFLKEELAIRVEKLLEVRHRLQAYYQSLISKPAALPEPSAEPGEAEFVKRARQLVVDHLDDNLFGVSELADQLAMSRVQVHRKITVLLGITASQFIRNIRLSRAKELLERSDLPIAEIAYQTGYADPGYFTRVFKQEFGRTPSNFRKANPQ